MHSVLTADMQESVLHTRARVHKLVSQIWLNTHRPGMARVVSGSCCRHGMKSCPVGPQHYRPCGTTKTKHSLSKPTGYSNYRQISKASTIKYHKKQTGVEERWTECGKHIHAVKGVGGPAMFRLCVHFPKQREVTSKEMRANSLTAQPLPHTLAITLVLLFLEWSPYQ